MNTFPQVNGSAPQGRFAPSMFLTPQGNVYVVENSLEVANVPMGTGLSVAICPSESLMFLKMYQNGQPAISAYSLLPYEQPLGNSNLEKILQDITARLEKIEGSLSSQKEGKISELL